MPEKDERVPVQVLIEPDFRRKLRVLLAEHDMTWGDLIIPHLEEFARSHDGDRITDIDT
jgi:hypothetical protein